MCGTKREWRRRVSLGSNALASGFRLREVLVRVSSHRTTRVLYRQASRGASKWQRVALFTRNARKTRDNCPSTRASAYIRVTMRRARACTRVSRASVARMRGNRSLLNARSNALLSSPSRVCVVKRLNSRIVERLAARAFFRVSLAREYRLRAANFRFLADSPFARVRLLKRIRARGRLNS